MRWTLLWVVCAGRLGNVMARGGVRLCLVAAAARGLGAGCAATHPSRTSFASFALQPGEIVNVGYLHLVAWRHGRNTFGRPVEMDIEVKDWPLAELDRFKAKRPHIYAQMKTRLMTVASAGAGSPRRPD